MSTWEATQDQLIQEHFEVIEIELPVVTGACTVDGVPGFGTPRTCDQVTNAAAVYKFTNTNAPLLPFDPTAFAGTDVYRVAASITETPTQLKPGKGLAGRGTISIKFTDFIGDPNPDAPGVTDDVKNEGTFFGKLNARQNLVNATLTVKLYRVEPGGDVDITNGFISRVYLVESLVNDGRGSWTVRGKDGLSFVNFDEIEWPPSLGYFIRADLATGTRNIGISQDAVIAGGDVVRIENELMSVDSVSNIGTPTAELRSFLRGSDIVRTQTLTKTRDETHDAGDELYLCDISDAEPVADFIYRLLIEAGVDAAFLPLADWQAELDEWLAGVVINTIWYKPLSIGKILTGVLTDYLLDLWFDPVAKQVKLSAINVWKTSSRVLVDGIEIDHNSLKIKPIEQIRASRALVIYGKPDLARPDDLEWYAQASIFRDTTLETPEEYGKAKDKRFELSRVLEKDPADLLVQRYVSRFGHTPNQYTWRTAERNLIFDVGEIVSIVTGEIQDAAGAANQGIRAQVTSIKPKYQGGRTYDVTALTFESAIDTTPGQPPSGTFVLVGNLVEVNLFVQAGAPGVPVDATFVLDAATVSSTDPDTAAMRCGAFPAGSTVTIILINATDWQGKGGDGSYWVSGPAIVGSQYGGLCFDSEGVTTAIYLSGAAPEGYTADGYLRAPGGGGGAGLGTGILQTLGGGGGAGINIGLARDVIDNPTYKGTDGTTTGTGGAGAVGDTYTAGKGGDWGQPGLDGGADDAANRSLGQAAGRGVKGGATVTLHGSTVARFINGIGEAVNAGGAAINLIRDTASIYYDTFEIWDAINTPLTLWANGGLDGPIANITDTEGDSLNGPLMVIEDPSTGLKMVQSRNFINRIRPAAQLPNEAQDFVIFVVFNQPAFAGDQVILSNYADTQFRFGTKTGGDLFIRSGGGTVDIPAGLSVDDTHVVAVRFDGASSMVWIDNDAGQPINLGNNDLVPLSLFNQGGNNGSFTGFFGNIGEFALVEQAINDLEVEAINDLFRARWGIA